LWRSLEKNPEGPFAARIEANPRCRPICLKRGDQKWIEKRVHRTTIILWPKSLSENSGNMSSFHTELYTDSQWEFPFSVFGQRCFRIRYIKRWSYFAIVFFVGSELSCQNSPQRESECFALTLSLKSLFSNRLASFMSVSLSLGIQLLLGPLFVAFEMASAE
jgi:hypothetical protein